MVLLGGLELLAAGYVIREYNKSKTEQRALEAEDASSSRRHRRHSHDRHTRSHSYDDRDRKHRRHRSESRDRRDSSRERRHRRDKEEYRPAEPVYRPDPRDRRGRVPVAAAAMQNLVPPQRGEYPVGPGRVNSAPPPQMRPPPTPQQQNGFPPTGWPQNWAQAHTPPPGAAGFPPQQQQQYQGPPPQIIQRAPTMPPQPQPIPQPQQQQRQMGPNGYPQDIKYGFDPRVPHNSMPAPPPYSGPSSSAPDLSQSLIVPGQGSDGGRRRRRRSGSERRSVSPNLGLYDEDEERRQVEPRVRFSMEEEILGEDERRNRRRERRERRGESPPPAYDA